MDNLKSFRNILKMDFIQGFNFYKKKLMLFLIIMLILNTGNIVNIINYNGNLTDLFFIIYKDLIFNEISMEVPINWLIINIFIIFTLGDFISENIKRDSNYILLRSKKISLYWISKCTWIVINVVFIYLILMVLTYLLGGVALGFNLGSSKLIDNELVIKVPHLTIIISIIITYILTSTAMVFIQCTLSMVINSRYSFLITTIILTISIVSKNKFFVGIHSMILRHNYFNVKIGLSIRFSIIYTIFISVILSIFGYKLLKHKDFI
ncbi:hypothetical protein ACOAKC_02940 [Hathewaya histolytica]|uniref:hypothetical protein n=1 Tax=Hathewaya histolytica TaxID=1498 RepID=UPI003B67401F